MAALSRCVRHLAFIEHGYFTSFLPREASFSAAVQGAQHHHVRNRRVALTTTSRHNQQLVVKNKSANTIITPSSDYDYDDEQRRKAQKRVYDARWQYNFERVKAHIEESRKKDPGSNSSLSYLELEDDYLRGWLGIQRALCRQRELSGEENTLTDDRREKLESLAGGFSLFPLEERWQLRYEQVCAFLEERGCFPTDCNFENLNEHERTLYYWVQKQRRDYKVYKKGKKRDRTPITEERIAKLKEIGFSWNEHDSAWQKHYADMVAYWKHHGHCLVPYEYPSNQSLSTWVRQQRDEFRKFRDGKQTKMNPKRFKLLQELDFCWNAVDAKWLRQYQELKEYMQLNGYGSTPSIKENKWLHGWVRRQSKQYKAKAAGKPSSLTDERHKLLDEIGFPFHGKRRKQ